MHTSHSRTRRRRIVAWAAAMSVPIGGVALLAPSSVADTQVGLDGDIGNIVSGDLRYGTTPGDRACDTMGAAVSGRVNLRYNGSSHFTAGEGVILSASKPAALGFSQIGSSSISNPWNTSSPDLSVPFAVSVPPGTPNGTYAVAVTARGATSNYVTANSPSSFSVVVDCDAPTNQPPTVGAIQGVTTVNEGDVGSYQVDASDSDGDVLSYAWTVVAGNAALLGVGDAASADAEFTDGPSSVTLQVAVSDGHHPAVIREIAIDQANVAPSITALTTSAATVLVGQPVTFTGTGTDPSGLDIAAGLQWSFDGGAFGAAGSNTYTTTFASCGVHRVDAVVRDKDGGESQKYSSGAVAVHDAGYLTPLRQGVFNKVQKGQVVPVKVNVSCNGVFTTGLSPSIQLLSGDVDASTDSGDASVNVPSESVSAADTSGVMREVDGQYLYNLRVPSTSTTGQKYTVRVRPFGAGTGGSMYVVLEIRK